MIDRESFILHLHSDYTSYLRKITIAYKVRPDDREDLIQDVFEIAIRKIDILMTYKDPKVWLGKTMRNCIRNYQRLHANRFNCSLEDYKNFPAPEGGEPLSHVLPSQLSESEKEILTWNFEEKIGYEEMSKRLGITEAYCRVKVCRIIKKCQKLMEK